MLITSFFIAAENKYILLIEEAKKKNLLFFSIYLSLSLKFVRATHEHDLVE